MEALQQKKTMYADGKKKYPIKDYEVSGWRLGVVSYNAVGKYTPASEMYWFDELPQNDMDEMEWPTATGHAPNLAPGHGWWPVVSPRLTRAARGRFTNWSEINHLKGAKGILLVCYYQPIHHE